ncbi:MAG: LLM class flavin-dependent oxidoreductase [Jiangellaceae bacterium]
MTDTTVRFGILILQDAPYEELVERWRRAEDLGFDAAYVADHSGDYRDLDRYWLDGWAALAHLADRTDTIRIGTLVANPLFRHPAQLARQAAAVDCLSDGRLELGIGTGIAGFDHDAVGEPYWPPAERAARFAEYVAIVDGVLRSPGRSYRHAGQHYRTSDIALNPPPQQQPRPPITVGGQSPTVLQVAARHADCWNTHGPFGATMEQIAERTAHQNRRLDALCEEAGRDPTSLRRSLLLFDALDAWTEADRFEKIVDRFLDVGMREFVVFWPPPDRLALLERAAETMTALRS